MLGRIIVNDISFPSPIYVLAHDLTRLGSTFNRMWTRANPLSLSQSLCTLWLQDDGLSSIC